MFDPESFMHAAVEDALETKRIPVPAGEYDGKISKLEVKSGTIGKGDRAGETWGGLKVTYELTLTEQAKADTGRETALVNDMIMLDLTPSGALDLGKGKNIQLGRLYEACGLNIPGMAKSPAMCEGRYVKVLVRHELDKDDSTKTYERVGGVRKP